MTDQQIKDKFYKLSKDQQKQVNWEAKIIRECGVEAFWVDTGCRVDDPNCYWFLKSYAMESLGLISYREYVGQEV